MDKNMIKSIRCELERQMKFALAKMNFKGFSQKSHWLKPMG